MPYIYEVWQLVEIKDEPTDTWELLQRFPDARRARHFIQGLAGFNVLTSEDNDSRFWFENTAGIHTYRIEPVLV